MRTRDPDRPSPRERLLAAADELFYAEGVQSVGIDRVIERADVSKASLYKIFGSKDELVRAYLAARHTRWREHLMRQLDTRFHSPRQRLLGVFQVLAEAMGKPEFRGCPFVNACAESRPEGAVMETTAESRAWRRGVLVDLAAAAGAADPGLLADQLGQVYDGAQIAQWMDRDPAAGATARATAAVLLDAAMRGHASAPPAGPA